MIIKQNVFLNTNRNNIINLFWSGFVIYSITGISIRLIPGISSFTIPLSIQSLGLIFIFFATLNFIKWEFENQYLKTVFLMYMLWLLIVTLRGLSLDYQVVKNMFFDAHNGVMPYLVPLILLVPWKVVFIKHLFGIIVLFSILFVILHIMFGKFFFTWDRRDYIFQGFIETSSKLSIPAGFILLTYKYHTFKIRILAVIVLVVGLLMAIYGARRNLVFIYSTQILFSILLYLSVSKSKLILIFYTVFLSFLMIYYFQNTFLKKENPIFSYLVERGLEDTRTGVELAFYADFNKIDWIIGRGITGTYYCPGIEENRDYRHVIETGYLQMILRGGLISFILILLIAIPAALLGLFFSKNRLSKAVGIWILLWGLYLYPTTMEAFSLFYIIFWVLIGVGYSNKIRNMSDNHIVELLYRKKKADNRVLFNKNQS